MNTPTEQHKASTELVFGHRGQAHIVAKIPLQKEIVENIAPDMFKTINADPTHPVRFDVKQDTRDKNICLYTKVELRETHVSVKDLDAIAPVLHATLNAIVEFIQMGNTIYTRVAQITNMMKDINHGNDTHNKKLKVEPRYQMQEPARNPTEQNSGVRRRKS